MIHGHFSVPPSEHSLRKPFQAFATSDDLRKSNAKSNQHHIKPEEDWREKAAEENIMRNFRALIFLVLFSAVAALVLVVLFHQ